MTQTQKQAISNLYQSKDFHYNTLWEYCEHNQVDLKEAIRYIAETFRPEGCIGCKRIGPYLENPDCGHCSRRFKDYYQKA